MKEKMKRILLSMMTAVLGIGLFGVPTTTAEQPNSNQKDAKQVEAKNMESGKEEKTTLAKPVEFYSGNTVVANDARVANQPPVLTFLKMGGEVLKSEGYVPVNATDPDGDGIKFFEYYWDYADNDKNRPMVAEFAGNSSSVTYKVPTPTENGLHILYIFARDIYGNKSIVTCIPYRIVDSYGPADTTKPVMDFSNQNEIPPSRSNIELGRELTIRASDPETGIYYIAYAWTRSGEQKPTSFEEYTSIVHPAGDMIKINAPTEKGAWQLRVFAANSQYNEASKAFERTEKIYLFNYNIVDITPPTIELIGNEKMEVPLNGTFTDPGARATDNYDAERIIYSNDKVDTSRVGPQTIRYQAIDESGNQSNIITRTVTVVGDKDTYELTVPSKKSYKWEEEIDLTGAQIKVTTRYGEVRYEVVTKDMFKNFSTTQKVGACEAIFSYQGTEVIYSYNVEDRVVGYEIVPPTKTTYAYGEELDLSGAQINSVMESGRKELVEQVTSQMISGYNKTQLGAQEIIVNYQGSEYKFTINVTKANINMSDITLEEQTITYDGNTHTAQIQGTLPEGITNVDYEYYLNGNKVNEVKNAGIYTVKAIFTVDGNHNAVDPKETTLTITKRDVTVTIANKTSVYGEEQATLTSDVTAGTVVENDDLGITLSKEQGTDVKEYAITGTASNGNYNVTFIEGTYTITKRNVTVTIENKTSVYGEELDTLTSNVTEGTVLESDDLGITLSKEEGTDVKDYVITGTASNENYNVTFTNGTYTITKRNVTVTIDNKSSVYGETFATLTSNVTEGTVLENDELGITLSKEEGTDVKDYVITGTASNENYNVTFTNGTYTITKRNVTVTIADKSSVYGEEQATLTSDVTTGTVIGEDDLGITLSKEEGTDAKEYVISGTASNENYNVTFIEGTYTITKRDVTVTIADKTSVYGEELTELTSDVTEGTVIGEDDLGITLSKEEGTDAKEYVISGTASNENYNVTFTNGTYTITKRKVTVTIDDKSSVYGETLKELTSSVTEGTVIGEDDLGITLSREPGDTMGTYVISGTATNANYEVTFIEGTYRITAERVVVTIANKTSVYGEPEEKLTYEITQGNVPEGQDLGISLSKEQGTDAGEYVISGTATNPNYTVDFTNGTYTITKRPVTVTIADKTSVYGDEQATLTSSVTEGTVLENDELGITLSKEEGTDAKEYVISGTASNENYNVTFTNGTYTITKRPVTVTIADKTSVYGEEFATLTSDVTEGTVIGEDDLGITLSKEEGTDVKEYAITGTASNENYNVTFTNGTYTITKAEGTLNPDYQVPTVDAVTYDPNKTLADITLPEGWAWAENTTTPTVSQTTYKANYTSKNNNYADVKDVEISLTVNKAEGTLNPDYQVPTIDAVTYDPNKTLADITLPEGWAWVENTIVPTADQTSYNANYTSKNNNYADVENVAINLTVNKIEQNAPQISLSKNQVVAIEEAPVLTVANTPADGGKVRYSTDDETVATIDENGIITLNGAGTVTITVTFEETANYSKSSAQTTLTITKATLSENDFTMTQNEVEFDGEVKQVTVEQKEHVAEELKFEIHYFEREGEIETEIYDPIAKGTYTVKIVIEEASKYEATELTLGKLVITARKQAKPEISLSTNEVVATTSTAPTLTVNNSPAEKGSVSYTSSDASVATIDEKGIITIIGAGKTNITVTFGETPNYSENSETVELTVTRDKVELSDFNIGELTVEYSGQAQNVEVTPKDVSTGITTSDITVKYFQTINEVETQVTPINVGTYTVKAIVAQTAKYEGTTLEIGTLEITVKAQEIPEIHIDKQEMVATQEAPVLTLTNEPADNAKTIYTSSNTNVATINENGIINIVGAGSTTITVTFEGTNNYTESSASINLTVTRDLLSIEDFDITGLSAVYDEQAKTVTVTPKETVQGITEEQITVKYFQGEKEVVNPTEVGSYTVKAIIEQTAKYEAAELEIGTLVINSKQQAMPDIRLSSNPVFVTEEAPTIELKNAPVENGTISYSSSNANVATIDENGIITITGVGETQIKVTFGATTNYSENSNEVTLNVIKDTLIADDFEIEGLKAEYDGIAKVVTLTPKDYLNGVTTNHITVKYYTVQDGGEEKEVTNPTTVGEYIVRAVIAETANYQAGTIGIGKLIISARTQAKPEISLSKQEVVATEQAPELVLANRPAENGTISYSSSNLDVATIDENGNITLIGLGETEITVTFEATNNYTANSATINLKVSRATLSKDDFDISGLETEYEGKTKQVSVTPKEGITGVGTIKVRYFRLRGEIEQEIAGPIAVGTYIVRANIAESAKYEAVNFDVGTLVITKAPQPEPEATLSAQVIHEGQPAPTLTVTSSPREKGKTSYSSSNTNVATIDENGVISIVGVGATDIEVTFSETVNYKENTKSIKLVVVKDVLTEDNFILENNEQTYDGTAKQVTVKPLDEVLEVGEINVKYYQGENEVTNPTNAGTYKVVIDVAGTEEFKPATIELGKLTIKPVEITITANDKTSAYGEEIVTLDYEMEGSPVAGETINVELETNASKTADAGNYPITANITASDNYDITFVDGKYVITKQQQPIPTVTLSEETVAVTATAPTLEVTNLSAENGSTTYVSSNENVATIDANGKITLVGVGSTTITVTFEETTNYTKNSANVTLNVTRDTLTISNFDIQGLNAKYDGQPKQVTLTPTDATTGITSQDITVKYYQGENEVTNPTNVGTYTVKAIINQTAKYEEATIEVGTLEITANEQPTPAISLDKQTTVITEAAPVLSLTNAPAEQGTISYDSSNKAVATIDNTGKITILQAGKTTITVTFEATTNYTETSETLELTVIKDTLVADDFTVTGLDTTFDGTAKTVTVTPKETITGIAQSNIQVKYYDVEDGTEILEPTAVGSYDVKAIVEETANYQAAELEIGTLVIKKAPQVLPQISLSKETAVATAQGENLPKLTVANGAAENGTVTYTSSNTNVATIDENGNISLVGAGETELTVTFGATFNYSQNSNKIKLTVTRDILTKEHFTVESLTAEYTAQAKTVNVTSQADGVTSQDFEIKFFQEVEGAQKEVTPINVGSYTVKAIVNETAKYEAGTIELGTFTITAKEQTKPDISLSKEETVITGEAPVLTVKNQPAENGEITYTSSNTNVATIDEKGIITLKAAGETTITVTFGATTNYSANASTITLTVIKDTLTVDHFNVEGLKAEYDKLPKTVTVTPKDEVTGIEASDITVKYYEVEGENETELIGENPAAVGSYLVKAEIAETANYNQATIEIGTLVISPKAQETPNITLSSNKVLITGEAPELKVNNTPAENGEVTYTSSNPEIASINENGEISLVAAGETTITVTFGATYNYSETSSSLKLTVERDTLTKEHFDIGELQAEYDKTAKYVTVTPKTTTLGVEEKDITIEYYELEGSIATKTETPIAVGNYQVKAVIGETANYNAATIEIGTLKITQKAQALPEISLDENTVKVTSKTAPVLTVKNTPAESGKVSYSSSNTNVATINENGIINIVGAGETELTVTFGATYNYSANSNKITLTVIKDTLNQTHFNVTGLQAEYTGDAKTVSVQTTAEGVTAENFTVKYYQTVDGQEKEITNPTEVGNYTVKAIVEETLKYEAGTVELGTLQITAKTQVEPSFSLDKQTAVITGAAPALTLTNAPAENGTITYSSSNEQVATIDGSGKIQLVGAGETSITVTFGKTTNYSANSKTITLTVIKDTLTKEHFEVSELQLEYSNSAKTVSVLPKTTTLGIEQSDISVEYYIVDGDEEEEIQDPTDVGNYEVRAVIRETANYEPATIVIGTLEITAKPQEYPVLSLDGTTVVATGAAPVLTVENSPAEDGRITYASSNPEVATIDSTGAITLVGAGETRFTVTFGETANYSAKSSTITLTVTRDTLTKEHFDIGSLSAEYTGDAKQVSVLPKSTTTGITTEDFEVKYYQTINEVETEVTPIAVGNYTVKAIVNETAKYNEGTIEIGTLVITAKSQVEPEIRLDKTTAVITQVAPVLTVSNKPEENGTVSYTSSNNNVATINENGIINIVGAGETTITVTFGATTNYSAKSSTVTLNVIKDTLTINDFAVVGLTARFDGTEKQVKLTPQEGINGIDVQRDITIKYYELEGEAETELIGRMPVAVGSYKVKAFILETANYEAVELDVGTLVINSRPQEEPNVVLSKDTVLMTETAPTIEVKNTPAENGTITYASSNNNVATIAQDGTITLVGAGSTNITVTFGATENYKARSKTVTLTVKRDTLTKEHFDIDGLQAEYDKTPKYVTVTPKTTTLGIEAKDITVEYYEVDGSISTKVEEPIAVGNYQVKAVIGQTKYYEAATIDIGTLAISAQLQVKPVISLSENTVLTTAKVGPVLTVENSPAESGKISYTSSNPNVATIDENKNITIVGAGSTEITVTFGATFNYSENSSKVTLTVNKDELNASHFDVTGLTVQYNNDKKQAVVTPKATAEGVEQKDITVKYFQGETEVDPINVGSYTVKAIVEETAKYNAATLEVGTLVISSKPQVEPSISLDKQTAVITQAAPVLTVSNSPAEQGTISYESSNTEVATIDEDGTIRLLAAGVTDITVTFEGTNNYSANSKTITLTVIRDTLTSEHFDMSNITAEYDGTAKYPVVAPKTTTEGVTSNDYEVVYYEVEGDAKTQIPAPIAVGSYLVVVEANQTANYEAGNIELGTFTITPKAQDKPQISLNENTVLTTATVAPKLTVENSSKENGKISYTSSNNNVATIDGSGIITIVGAGQTTITVTFGATENYSENSSTVTLTVNKDELTLNHFDVTGLTATYNNDQKQVVVTPKATTEGVEQKDITVKYFQGETEVDPINVGSYTVKAEVQETAKYKAATLEVGTLVISSKAQEEPVLSLDKQTAVITETAPVLTVDNTPAENGTVSYDSNNKQVATIDANGDITLVGAGETVLTVTFGATDNYSANSKTITLTVIRDTLEIGDFTVEGLNAEFSGTAKAVTVTPNQGISGIEANDITVEYYQGETKVEPINVGSYTVKAVIAQTTNYNAATLDAGTLVISAKAQPEPVVELSSNKVLMTQNAPTLEVKNTSAESGVTTYTSSNTDVATIAQDGTITLVGAGETELTVTFGETTNYSATSKTVTLTVERDTLTNEHFDIGALQVEYTGDEKQVSVTPKATTLGIAQSDITVKYYQGEEDEEEEILHPTDVGNYTVKAIIKQTKNYKEATLNIGTLEISAKLQTKPNISLSATTVVATATAPTLTVNNEPEENGAITYNSSKTSVATIDDKGIITLVGAGETDITVTFGETANHSANSEKVTLTVTRDNLSKEHFNIGSLTAVYNNDEKQVTVTPKATTEGVEQTNITVEYYQTIDGTETKVTPKNVGDYVVKAVVTETAKYNSTTIEIGTLTITPKAQTTPAISLSTQEIVATVAVAPTLTLTNAPEESGTISYDSTEKTVATIAQDGTITLVGAGETEITVTFGATDNYSETTAKLTLTVTRDNLSLNHFDVAGLTAEYSNEAKVVTVTPKTTTLGVSVQDVNVKYYIQEGDAKTEVTNPTSVGEYLVEAEIAQTARYNQATISVGTLKITPQAQVEPSLTLSETTAVATGVAPELTVGNQPAENGAITYASSDTEVATIDENGIITLVGAGTTDITVTFGETANYSAKSNKITLTVTRGTLTAEDFNVTGLQAQFDGTAKTVTVLPKETTLGVTSSDITVEYYRKRGEVESKVAEATVVGEYTIKAVVEQTSRYEAATITVGTLTISAKPQVTPNISLSPETAVITETAPVLTVENSPAEGGNVSYESSNTNVATIDEDGTINLVAAGQTTITVKFGETSNYSQSESAVTLTVIKDNLDINDFEVSNLTATFDGTDKQVTLTPKQGINGINAQTDITINYYQMYGEVPEQIVGLPKYVGTYVVEAVINETANYNEATLDVGEFVITAKQQVAPDILLSKTEVLMTQNAPTIELKNGPEERGAITYTSSKPEVATIDNTGAITLVGAGETTITVTYGATANYSANSNTVNLTVSRDTVDENDFTVTGLTAEYDGQAKVVTVTPNDGIEGITANDITVKYFQTINEVETEVTPINVGTYTVKAEINQTAKYEATTIEAGTLTISAKAQETPAISLDKQNMVATEVAPVLSLTNSPAEQGTINYDSSDKTVATISDTGIITVLGAGQTQITVTFGATTNYSTSTANLTLTVTRDTLAKADFAIEGLSTQYDGTAKVVTVTPNDDIEGITANDIQVKYYQVIDGKETEVTPTNVGSYTVKAEINQTAKYEATTIEAGTLTITAKPQETPAISLDKQNMVATEVAPVLSLTNSPAEQGTINYDSSDKTVATISDTGIITVLGAGQTQITVTFGATTNYSTSTANLTLTVTRDVLEKDDFTVAGLAPEYDGQPKQVTVTPKDTVQGITEEQITVKYFQGETEVQNPTNVGSYTVKIAIAQTAKYEAVDMEIGTLTIGAKEQPEPQISLDKQTAVITETAPELQIANEPVEQGNVSYSSSDEDVVAIDENGDITLVGAGKATITVTFEQTANYSAKSNTIELTVIKDTLTETNFTVEGLEQEFDGTAKTVTVTPNSTTLGITSDDITVEYIRIRGEQQTPVVAPNGAGEYKVKITVAETKYYEAVTQDAAIEKTLIISRKQQPLPDLTLSSNEVSIKGEAPTLTVNNEPNEKSSTTITYTSSNPEVATISENGEITLTGVGQTTFTVTFGASAYNYSENSNTITLNVTKAALTKANFTAEGLSQEYDGTAKTITVTPKEGITVGATNNIKFYQGEGDAEHEVQPINAGTYKVVMHIAQTEEYEETDITLDNLVISKRVIEVTANDKNSKYGEEIVELDYQITDGELVNANDITVNLTTTASSTSDVGEYTITGTITTTDNYTVTLVDGTYEITQAMQVQPEISLNKNEVVATAEGENIPVLTVANTAYENGAVSYTSSNESVATVENGVITLVGAGETTITVTFGATKNYTQNTNTVTLNVTRDTLTKEHFEVDSLTAAHDGQPKEVKVTPKAIAQGITSENFSVKYYQVIDGQETEVTPIEVGNYTVKVIVEQTAKYEEATITIGTLEISAQVQPKPEISLSKNNMLITEAAPTLNVNNSPVEEGTISYTSSNENVATIANGIITITGVGETEITVTFEETANHIANSSKVTLTVTKATLTIDNFNVEGLTANYNGEAKQVTVTPKEGINGISEQNINVQYFQGTTEVTNPTNVGSYTVKAVISETANYEAANIEVGTLVISSIQQTKPEISLSKNTVYTTDSAPTLTVANTPADGAQVTYTSSNENVATIDNNGNISLTGEVGVATITVTFGATDNYTANSAQVQLTVVKEANITINIPASNKFSMEVKGTIPSFTATATDENGNNVDVDINTDDIDVNVLGTYTVTFTATTVNGSAVETRDFEVVDTTAPTIELPQGIVEYEAGEEYVELTPTVLEDNYYGKDGITVTHSEVNMRHVGVQTVTYTATDGSNNAKTAKVQIRIKDTTAPTLKYDTSVATANTKFNADGTEAVQTFTRGGKYVEPKFIMTDKSDAELVCLMTAGYIDASKPGTYEVEYTAYDGENNTSTPIKMTVKVLNYAPTISTYSKTGAIEILQEKEYAYELRIEFVGTGRLYRKGGNPDGEAFTSGSKLSDGEYTLVATLEDGASSTKTFSINTKGPSVTVKVEASDGTITTETLRVNGYYEGKTTIIFDKAKVAKAKLVNNYTGQKWDNVDEIAGKVLEENDYNEYSLRLEDHEGRVTNIYSFAVDIY